MLKNNKGQGMGKVSILIFVFMSLIAVGIIAYIYNSVVDPQLINAFTDLVNITGNVNSTDGAAAVAGINQTSNLMNLGLTAIIFIILVFGFVSAFRKEPDEYQQY